MLSLPRSLFALLSISLLLQTSVHCRDIPDNVRTLYDTIRAQGSCNHKLGNGFRLSDSDSDTDDSYSYCGDYNGIIYVQGSSSGGNLADMDVDCDGQNLASFNGDSRCGSSTDTIPATSFQDDVQQRFGIPDFNAYVHTYVVFGNQGTKDGFVNFSPQDYGMQPLSVMAVVCGDKLVYGIWGDVNGDDQPRAAVGEASLALATLCFGNEVNGNNGHSEPDVLYIGFAGQDAVAPNTSVNWAAQTAEEFEASLAEMGDRLVQGIGVSNTANESTTSNGNGGQTNSTTEESSAPSYIGLEQKGNAILATLLLMITTSVFA